MNFVLRRLIRYAVANGDAQAIYAEVRKTVRALTPVEPYNEFDYTVDEMCRRNFESTQLHPRSTE